MGNGVCFLPAVGTAQTSLFGNTQNKLGTTLGTMGAFGATGFNSGANTLGFGAPQQPVGRYLSPPLPLQSAPPVYLYHSYIHYCVCVCVCVSLCLCVSVLLQH